VIKRNIAVTGFIFELLRVDLLYTDPKCHRFTTRPKEGYLNFSQSFRKNAPGYLLDKNNRCIPDPAKKIKTVDMFKLFSILKSKDESLMKG
jgi:hypothetical protein